MELVADPGILDVVCLLELVDNALADIAEGSDVIGKDPDMDAHLVPQLDKIMDKTVSFYDGSYLSLPHTDYSSTKILLDNRTNVLYTEAMKERRTIQTVQKSIAAFFRERRRMPSYAEMIDILGVKSKSVVHFWIRKLIQKGVIEKDETGHLRLTNLAFGIPMAGSVQAGFPSSEEEALCDILSMDEYLVTRPDSSFLLKVSGDSMNGEGIMDGDLVIVERGREPKHRDVVLAEVDREWTLKYFTKKGKSIVLEAANPKYPPIRPREELKIAGVVTAVIRKYHT